MNHRSRGRRCEGWWHWNISWREHHAVFVRRFSQRGCLPGGFAIHQTPFPGQSLALERVGEAFCRDILKLVYYTGAILSPFYFLHPFCWYERNDTLHASALSFSLDTFFMRGWINIWAPIPPPFLVIPLFPLPLDVPQSSHFLSCFTTIFSVVSSFTACFSPHGWGEPGRAGAGWRLNTPFKGRASPPP